jgi:hypothetical protein
MATTFYMARDISSTVMQGRVICRLVSMFQSIDELVDKNDHHHALELDQCEEEELVEFTAEYIDLKMS